MARTNAKSRIATLVFFDAVGSTALLTRVGPHRANELRQRLDGVCRDVIAAHDGREVKHLGDGMMLAFESCAAAVEAAAALQATTSALRRRETDLSEVRVGIAVGEVSEENGDLFGPPAVEAARLCAIADPGQILVTTLVAAMAASNTSLPMAPAGEQLLKGFDNPTALVEVVWQRDEAPVTLPPVVRGEASGPLMGRAVELARLRDVWAAAVARGGQLLLLAGEPGIGKTRLLAELAQEVDAAGGMVLWGRCDEDLNVAYQPFIEGLRHLVTTAPLGVSWNASLFRLLPDLAARFGIAVPTATPDEADRLALLDAVRDTLTAAAEQGPLLVVLDDLHWASEATLHMLRHVLRGIGELPVVVAATYRDTDLDRRHPLAEALGDLRRIAPTTRVAVSGLDLSAVTEMTAVALDDILHDTDIAQSILTETAGNAFFVTQLIHHLADSVDRVVADIDIPEGVRDVVSRRLSRLPEGSDELLSVAAIIGREFDAQQLGQLMPELGLATALELLDRAVGANLITERVGQPGCFEFIHALVRETLLSELTSTRRGHTHLRVAESVIAQGGSARVIAHHLLEAAPWSTAAEIAKWTESAIAESLCSVGWDEALELGARAIDTVNLLTPLDRRARCVVVRARGHAFLLTGDTARARAESDAAWPDVLSTGDPELIAFAAMERGNWSNIGVLDPNAVAYIEEALTVIPADDVWALPLESWRDTLLHMASIHDPARGARALDLAERARRTGDLVATYVTVNSCLYQLSGHPDLDRWEGWVDELNLLEPRIHGVEYPTLMLRDAAWTHEPDIGRKRFQVDLRRGDLDAARTRFGRLQALYDELDHMARFDVHSYAASFAMAEGRLDDAQASLDVAGTLIGEDSSLISSWGSGMSFLCMEQGRGREMEAMIDMVIAQNEDFDVLHALKGLIAARVGDESGARIAIERLSRADEIMLRPDSSTTGGIATLTRCVIEVDATERAEVFYNHVLPYDGQWFTMAQGNALLGSANSYLAALAALLGRDDEADARFESAIADDDARGLTLLAATTRGWWARALRARRHPEPDRARALADDVVTTGRRFGLLGLLAETESRL